MGTIGRIELIPELTTEIIFPSRPPPPEAEIADVVRLGDADLVLDTNVVGSGTVGF